MFRGLAKTELWLVGVGFFLFCAVLGVIVGLANSPVAGVTVTALVGLLSALLGSRKNADPGGLPIEAMVVGPALIIGSTALVIGASIGIVVKLHSVQKQEPRALIPWAKDNPPKNAADAVDWLIASQALLARGYTAEQIGELYKLDSKGGADNPFRAQTRLSDLLSKAPIPALPQPPLVAEHFKPGLQELVPMGPSNTDKDGRV